MLVTIDNVKNFEEHIQKQTLSTVHFGVDYVEQCKHINEALTALSERPEFKNVGFFKCDAEDLSEVSLKYNIDAAPTVLYFKSGIAVDRIDGADVSKISNKLAELNSSYEGEQPLEEILKKLITRHKVMLFMKGDRKGPRCGFSRQMIEILNGTGVEYDTFDILSNEQVRQGLKEYSDWPTYPQLYVNGELLGGLDIIKEMQANNELMSSLEA